MGLAPVRQIVNDATIVHGTISSESHTLLTLHSRSVGLFINAYNAINELDLVCQACERCVVNRFSLSSEFLTSLETTRAYAKLPEADTAL